MRISDWSSDVCSSDLPSSPRRPACKSGRRGQGGQSPIEVVDDVHHSARAGVYQQHIIIMTHPPIVTTSDGEPVTPRIGNPITMRIIAWLHSGAGANGMIARRRTPVAPSLKYTVLLQIITHVFAILTPAL